MSKTRCERCGREKVEVEPGENVWGCPVHDDPEDGKARCRGCWKYRRSLLHHISYKPERTVPMCHDCHVKLHEDSDFLSHLQPEMSRREAKRSVGGELKKGVQQSEAFDDTDL
jgi:hypothetical protein